MLSISMFTKWLSASVRGVSTCPVMAIMETEMEGTRNVADDSDGRCDRVSGLLGGM